MKLPLQRRCGGTKILEKRSLMKQKNGNSRAGKKQMDFNVSSMKILI